jgi:hypothetical protein
MENESNKMTAVEWLFKQLWNQPKDKLTWYAIIKQAKAMEKEQIENAYANGVDDEYEYHINDEPRKNTEQYYEQTYGDKK